MRRFLIPVFALPLLLAAAYFAVAESGEVVVLEHGEPPEQTRLWVVDLDGFAYLRGKRGRGWTVSVGETPTVRLLRNERWSSYSAEPAPQMLEAYEAAASGKYGLSERIRGLTRGGGESTTFRLAPIEDVAP